MALLRWRRPEIATIFDEMDRLMRTVLPRTFALEAEEAWVLPPVDIYETDKDVIVKAHIPGVKKEDLEVTVRDNAVTIRGEIKQEEEIREENYHCRELRYGSFARTVPLPVPVKEEEVTATFENGVLTIRAPKVEEETGGRKVEIK